MPDTRAMLRVTCIFWLIAKLISYKVWLTGRVFPIVPVSEIFENMPPYIHATLFIISITSLLTLIVRPTLQIIPYVLFFTEIFSMLADYSRWQPWEFQYLFILFIFTLNRNNKDIINTISFLLAALYFYSGLQKLNPGFLHQIWNNMILVSFLKIPHAVRRHPVIFYSGYFPAIIEAAAGLLLLFRLTRKNASVLLIVMHLFILIWLGPAGIGYNVIIWPWNILMIILLYFVFLKNEPEALSFSSLIKPVNLPVLIWWGILPVLNFWGYWDHYLSGSLYSGKLPLMAICVSQPVQDELLPYIKKDVRGICNGRPLIKLQSWAMDELNVPPYPELRVYNKIRENLSEKYNLDTTCFYYYRMPLKK